MQITVPLALEDFLTVIFSGIGLVLLTRMVSQMDRALGRMALIGTILTVAGGTLKATGKLILAMGGPDLPVLNLGLFPLIAPGFSLLFWALYQIRRALRNEPTIRRPWLVPSIVIGLFAVGSIALSIVGGPWRVPLILLSSLANVSLLIMLAVAAWKRGMRMASVFFVITLVVVLVMSQMAQMKFQAIEMIWFEQITQTIAQALFAIGAWQYGQLVESTYRRSMAAQPA